MKINLHDLHCLLLSWQKPIGQIDPIMEYIFDSFGSYPSNGGINFALEVLNSLWIACIICILHLSAKKIIQCCQIVASWKTVYIRIIANYWILKDKIKNIDCGVRCMHNAPSHGHHWCPWLQLQVQQRTNQFPLRDIAHHRGLWWFLQYLRWENDEKTTDSSCGCISFSITTCRLSSLPDDDF